MAEVKAEAEMRERAREWYVQKLKEVLPNYDPSYWVNVVELLAAFALQVVEETRREDARAICHCCAQPEYFGPYKEGFHQWGELKTTCYAAAIHELETQRG